MTEPNEMEVKTCRAQLDRLLQEKEKADLLLKFINDGIILVDLKGDVVYANRLALGAIGFSQELEEGFRISASDEVSKKKLRRSIQDILIRVKSSETIELGRNGKHRFFKARVRVCMLKMEALGIFITLREATVEYEFNAMKNDFFNSVEHAIRTPILDMQRCLELLEDSCSAMPKGLEYVSTLRRSGNKLFMLAQDILDMARTDAGKVKSDAGDKPVKTEKAGISGKTGYL